MKGLSNLDETYREYSLAPTDDLIRLWRSKVKATAGRLVGEASRRRRRFGVKGHFLVFFCVSLDHFIPVLLCLVNFLIPCHDCLW